MNMDDNERRVVALGVNTKVQLLPVNILVQLKRHGHKCGWLPVALSKDVLLSHLSGYLLSAYYGYDESRLYKNRMRKRNARLGGTHVCHTLSPYAQKLKHLKL